MIGRISPSSALLAAAVSLPSVLPAAARVSFAPYPAAPYVQARAAALEGRIQKAEDLWGRMLDALPGPLYSVDLATTCGQEATVDVLERLREVNPVLLLPSGEDGDGCHRVLFGLFPEEEGVGDLAAWLPPVSLYPPTLVRIEGDGQGRPTVRDLDRILPQPPHRGQSPATASAGGGAASTPVDTEAARSAFDEGTAAMARRDLQAAESAFRRAVEADPGNPPALHNLGVVLLYRKDYEAAEQFFRKALALDASYVKAYLNLSAALFGEGHADEAVRTLQKAVGIAPDDAEVRYTLAALLAETGRFAEAREQLTVARARAPNDPRILALEKALPPADAPSPAPAREPKVQEASKGIVEPPADLTAGPPAPEEGDAAAPASAGREPEGSGTSDASGLAARPDSQQHFQRGALAYDRGDLREAEREFLKAAETDPDNPNILNNLAAVYLDQGRDEEAAGTLRRALAADPDHVKARINLGGALYNLGRREEALQVLEEAEALAPRDPDVLYSLALFLAHDGDKERAREFLDRALKAAPYDARIRALDETIGLTGQQAFVAEPEIFLRRDPDRTAPVVGTLRFGESLEVLQRRDGWSKVRSAGSDGMEGWVVDGMLTDHSPRS